MKNKATPHPHTKTPKLFRKVAPSSIVANKTLPPNTHTQPSSPREIETFYLSFHALALLALLGSKWQESLECLPLNNNNQKKGQIGLEIKIGRCCTH